MDLIVSTLSLLCFSLFGRIHASQLLCQPVEQACSINTRTLTQGIPGKRGPQGVKGERGLQGIKGQKGHTGTVDYERFSSEIETGDNTLRARIVELENTIIRMKQDLDVLADDAYSALEWCRLRYGGKCYRALLHAGYDVTLQQGLDFCSKQGMELAEIEGPEQFQTLLSFVTSELAAANVADIFIGMSYTPSTGIFKFNNGTTADASFVTWYQDPGTSSGQFMLAMVAFKPPIENKNGVYITRSGNVLTGVLCQK